MKNKTIKTTKEHFEKYAALLKEKGDKPESYSLPAGKSEIETALENGDFHLNSIDIKRWDSHAYGVGWTRNEGDKKYKSLSEQICLLKHIAIYHVAGFTPIFEGKTK